MSFESIEMADMWNQKYQKEVALMKTAEGAD